MKRMVFFAAVAAVLTSAYGADLKRASFEARHELQMTIPAGVKNARIWFALPQESDPHQKIHDLKITCPYPYQTVTDSEGNQELYVEVNDPKERNFSILETFNVDREEIRSGVDAKNARSLPADQRAKFEHYLKADANVPLNDKLMALSKEIVGGEQNPVTAARKIYDWELDHVDYWIKDPKNKKASPTGNSMYCLENQTGNCSDFHSLWMSLARAAGIPTRMIFGSYFKLELAGIDADQSYHCWAEFYADGIGWVPFDVAAADVFRDQVPINDDNAKLMRLGTADGYVGPDPVRVDYYFGNIEERRVTWTVGRDLTLSPKQAAGPVNSLPKAYVEFDGKVAADKAGWVRKLTYKQK